MRDHGARSWKAALRLGLPVGASLAVHGVLLLILASVAWRIGLAGVPAEAPADTMISVLPPGPIAPETAPSTPAGAESGAPSAPAPTLAGLFEGGSEAPVLRSAAEPEPVRLAAPVGAGVSFAGLGTRQARSVVYVVDASGAMVSNFKWIQDELIRSIRALSPAQQFQVVLFRDRAEAGMVEFFNPEGSRRARLLPATAANKGALAAWLEGVFPSGRSNPLDGLRSALEFKPDAVFLLSRGLRRTGGGDGEEGAWGRGRDEILVELNRLNPRRRERGPRDAVIKAIQFLEEDPTGVMRAIGDEHGDGPGSYRVLRLEDLGAR